MGKNFISKNPRRASKYRMTFSSSDYQNLASLSIVLTRALARDSAVDTRSGMAGESTLCEQETSRSRLHAPFVTTSCSHTRSIIVRLHSERTGGALKEVPILESGLVLYLEI